MDGNVNHSSVTSDPQVPAPTVVGDVIGSTVYSERFVLRLLLKFSEIAEHEATLENDLCILWDMTTEKDVIEFLLKHDFIALVRFAWPSVRLARTAEILVGVLANMCCFADASLSLCSDPVFCSTLVQLVHSDDTPVLVQLLRLINACLHDADGQQAASWLDLFAAAKFPSALAFMLSNSANTDLLETALETLNVVSSTCNIDSTRTKYFQLFVSEHTVDGLQGCFEELAVKQVDALERQQRERLFLVSLELTMHLAGFDKSLNLYKRKKNALCSMITTIIEHYSSKILSDKEIDSDFIDVLRSVNSIQSLLNLHSDCDEKCFWLLYDVWKALKNLSISEKEPCFEDSLSGDMKAFSIQLNGPLCCYLCKFLELCPSETFNSFLNFGNENFENILSGCSDQSVCELVRIRNEEILAHT